jgi:hypothetical protein
MKTGLLFILLLTGLVTHSQSVSSTVSRKKILVGEELLISLTCKMPKNAVFRYIPEQGVIPARKKLEGNELTLEPTDKIEQLLPFRDTVTLQNGEKTWKGIYTVSGWDEGNYIIQGQKILVNDSTFIFPEVEFKINLVKAEKGKDIYDIEENFTELPPNENPVIGFLISYWWIIALLLLILGIFLYIRKTRQEEFNPSFSELSLKERTLLAIDMLEKERLWEKGKLKEHYIELSFILRSYLSSRYDLNLLENTTQEAQLKLSHKELHPETIKVIGGILDHSDLVKFARSSPQESEVLKVSQQARQIVAETSPIEFEHGE